MLSRRLRDNVLSLVAIFIAITGVSYAAGLQANSVKSKHIKNGHVRSVDVADDTTPNALTGTDVAANSLGAADIDEGSLDSSVLQSRISGSCPAGQSVRSVAQNGTVTCEADDATTYAAGDGLALSSGVFSVEGCAGGQVLKRVLGSWTCAGDETAPTGPAGGDLDGTYPNPTLRAAEAKHYVGAAGEPAFQNGWTNVGGNFHNASFYKDRSGVVHLSGAVTGGTYGFAVGNDIFHLPSAYTPCGVSNDGGASLSELAFPVIAANNIGRVGIIDGPTFANVRAQVGSGFLSLDGITWRADGC